MLYRVNLEFDDGLYLEHAQHTESYRRGEVVSPVSKA